MPKPHNRMKMVELLDVLDAFVVPSFASIKQANLKGSLISRFRFLSNSCVQCLEGLIWKRVEVQMQTEEE
jgi:hypothetical protein